MRMATRNIYTSAEDEENLWKQAEVLASRERRSVSWVVAEALRMYLRSVAIEQDKQARRSARQA
jgi:hypothetical protein